MDEQKLREKRVYGNSVPERWITPHGSKYGVRSCYESSRSRRVKRRVEKTARHGARQRYNRIEEEQ